MTMEEQASAKAAATAATAAKRTKKVPAKCAAKETEEGQLPEKRRSGEKIGELVRLRAIELLQDGRSNEQVNDTLHKEKLLADDDNIGRATFAALRRESRKLIGVSNSTGKSDLHFSAEGVQVGEWALSQGLLSASALMEAAKKELLMPSGRLRLSLGAPMIGQLNRMVEINMKLLLMSLATDKSEPLLACNRLLQAEQSRTEEDPAIEEARHARLLHDMKVWQVSNLLDLRNLIKSGAPLPTLEDLKARGYAVLEMPERTGEIEAEESFDDILTSLFQP